MEVHHHTHTNRKRWKHYLWEFLMLFLAVFCGFLAEYQLEHKVEKERGKQYVKSFAEDLKTDTAVFANLIKQYEEKVAVLHTMFECYDSISKGRDPGFKMLELLRNSSHFPDLFYTDRTLQQLKNAGGLRLIPLADADSIIEYDKLIRIYLKIESTSYQTIQNEIRNSIFSMNNFQGAADYIRGKPNYNLLFSTDKELINRYFNQLLLYQVGTVGNLEDLKQINEKAKTLIYYFNKKYRLK